MRAPRGSAVLSQWGHVDAHHKACLDLLQDDEGPLVTSPLVLAEAAYLLDRQLGPEAGAALFDSVRDGSLQAEDLVHSDWARVAELVRRDGDIASRIHSLADSDVLIAHLRGVQADHGHLPGSAPRGTERRRSRNEHAGPGHPRPTVHREHVLNRTEGRRRQP
jgi:predicted nucleic acid-binding protein